MQKLLFLLVFSTIQLTNAATLHNKMTSPLPVSQPRLIITRQTKNKTETHSSPVLSFADNEEVSLTCTLNCSECYVDTKYTLRFYLNTVHPSGITQDREYSYPVTVKAGSSATISKKFILHKGDTEIVCKAVFDYPTLVAKVNLHYDPLMHQPRKHEDHRREDKQLEPSLEAPKVTPNIFNDTGKSFAVFICTALHRHKLALLSWLQIKGSERVLLKTAVPNNSTSTSDIMRHTLNKTLTESDRDSELYCATRYIIDGSLTNEKTSKRIRLAFNRTITPSGVEEKHVLNFNDWVAINGVLVVVAIIVVAILVAVILKYKSKVQEYKIEESMRNRPAMIPPSAENVYDQVYGHGAGLKRPRLRPSHKRN